MRIADLRRDHPDWTWTCENHGFAGLLYRGTKGERSVTIRAYSVLSGYSDDEFSTVWRVDDGEWSNGYFLWSSRERNERTHCVTTRGANGEG